MPWYPKKSFWIPPPITADEAITKDNIEKLLANPKYEFLKYNKFYFLIRPDKSKDPFVYHIKYINNQFIHSRTERLNKNMTDDELYHYIKYPKYQWIRTSDMRRPNKVDWQQLEVFDLEENFERLKKIYPYNNLKLYHNWVKRKQQERFYITYDVVILNEIYSIRSKSFSVHERSFEYMKQVINKKQGKYLIEVPEE